MSDGKKRGGGEKKSEGGGGVLACVCVRAGEEGGRGQSFFCATSIHTPCDPTKEEGVVDGRAVRE